MKAPPLFLALFVFSSAQKPFYLNEEFAEVREKCLEQSSLSLEDLKKDWRADPDTENRLCFHRCVLVEEGLLNQEFEVQEEKTKEIMGKANVKDEEINSIVECLKGVGKFEECKDVKKMFGCLPQKAHD